MAFLMMVEDDTEFAEAIAELLQSEGHEVSLYGRTGGVLPQLAQRPADAVILDVMFPEDPMAGFDLARAIRRVYPDLPILMLTAVNQEFPLGFSGNEIRPPWLPVSDFLDKPVDFGVLVDRLNKLLDAPRSP